MNNKQYSDMIDRKSPSSPILKNCTFAFLIGGIICAIGQAFLNLYQACGFDETKAGTLTSITLIFITTICTGLGFFDNIAKYAGAGTIVPITGFANAIVSPAIEAKTEGYVLGVGAKIFTIAGPVIVFGTAASYVAGIIYWLMSL